MICRVFLQHQFPKQLGEALFVKLGLSHGKKTKTGYSTNAEVLESLKWAHPAVKGSCLQDPYQTKIHLLRRPSESSGRRRQNSIPASIRRKPGQAESAPRSPICRTSRCGQSWEGNCGGFFCAVPVGCWWTPIIPRLSCECWLMPLRTKT